MVGITKQFPLVVANDDVSFSVNWGEVHALIGENGAGKSTLMKILYGMQPADSGTIAVDGNEVDIPTARAAIELGIGMVHQHFMLVDTLSVTENLILGEEPRTGPVLDYREARKKTRNLIQEFDFDINASTKVGDLAVGWQQQVEILKALYRDARILIMDEPTAVLTPQEARGLFRFLREFVKRGNAVIFISHKLDEVMEVCDRMSVMRDGKMVGTVERDKTNQRELANMMVGREVLLRVEKTPAHPGSVALEVNDLQLKHPETNAHVLDHVSFSLRNNEILGIAAIEGNGQSELIECITGLRSLDKGTVTLNGVDLTPLDARGRRRAGLSHVPEDRNGRGLVLAFSATLNSILGDHYEPRFGGAFGSLNMPVIEKHAVKLINEYDVRPRDPSIAALNYSGGNAQKLIVAREMSREPQALLLAQPTRGVDIGAIEFIHRQIVAARDAGLPVLLVSADLNEVMSLSDRILVMYQGRIMGELTQEEATAEKLGLLMAGSTIDQVA